MSSLTLFTDEDRGGDDSGLDFSLFGDGCFDPTLFDDAFIPQLSLEFFFLIISKIYQHFEIHQNQSSSDHLRFEPLGGAGGTLGRETKQHESVSVTTTSSTTTPTAIDLLSKIIGFKLIRQVSASVPKAISNYLLNIPSIEFNNDWGDYTNPTLVSDNEDDLEEDTTTDDDDYNYGDDCVYRSLRRRQGYPLIEVFSVVIKENKNKYIEKKPGGGGGVLSSLWGTIRLEGGCGSEYIYYTKREDSESISLSGGGKTALLLTGPSRIFHAFGTVTIEVALMDRRNLSLDDYDDDVFCRGTIYWDFITGSSGKYENGGKFSSSIRYNPCTMFDKPLATKFHGRAGSVTINCVMWLDGVTATVEVTLLNTDGVNVYGLIRAGNTCGVFNYWSVLFSKKKESDESIGVRRGQLIPLSRSIVAVNRIASLKVSAELYVRRDRDLSQDDEDDEIVNGTVEFPAQNSGTSEKDISGWHGEIRVKVTWKDR